MYHVKVRTQTEGALQRSSEQSIWT